MGESIETVVTQEVIEGTTVVESIEVVSVSALGPPGPGVPRGGTTGQVLAKASDDDRDTEWVTGGGGGGGGTVTSVSGTAPISVATGTTTPVVSITAATTGAAGSMSAVDKAKLDGIEANATADMTAAEILTAVKTVDGAGSGLDADLLDGQSSAAFAAASHGHAGEDITSGTVADARIASTIARDSEVTSAISTHAGATDPHGDRAYADGLFAANDAMLFRGAIDCSANPNYPAADAGHTYKVSVAGKVGGGSGPNVEVGDTLICAVDGTSAGTHAAVGANWFIVQVNLDGAVIGPASAVSGKVATFSGTSGKLIADSGVTLGGAASLNVGTTAGTVAAGDDSRLSDTRTPTDNSVTSAKIANGAIVNDDINASAGIEASKLDATSIAELIRDTIGTALVEGTGIDITVNDGADTITIAATGGAGGLSWTQEVDEDGSSYAAFSTISGTWASNGTIIQQTDTGAAERFAIHSELLPGSAVIEAEVRVPSGTAGTRIIGIGFAGTAGASSDGGNRYGDRLSMILQRVGGSWSLLAYNTSLLGAATFSASATTDTWYKMRIVRTAATYDLYFDGVLITSVLGPAVMRTATNLLLYAYADCDFRNIKAWAADLNLPA